MGTQCKIHFYSTISAGFSTTFLRGTVYVFHFEVLLVAEECKSAPCGARKKMANTVFNLNSAPLWVSHYDSLLSSVSGCCWCMNALQCT